MRQRVQRTRVQHPEVVPNLAPPYQRQLTSYAIAAAAAGVSILALSGRSQAEVVYKQVHQVIGDGASFNLDLTGNGTVNLTLENKHRAHCSDSICSSSQFLEVNMASANDVVYNVYGAVAMKRGMQIAPRDAWRGGVQRMASMLGSFATSGVGGSWVNVNDRYLGLKFEINGETHFGWARLNVQVQIPLIITTTLTGYAYETTANKAIAAGQTKSQDSTKIIGEPNASLTQPSPNPATLGALALGALGRSAATAASARDR